MVDQFSKKRKEEDSTWMSGETSSKLNSKSSCIELALTEICFIYQMTTTSLNKLPEICTSPVKRVVNLHRVCSHAGRGRGGHLTAAKLLNLLCKIDGGPV